VNVEAEVIIFYLWNNSAKLSCKCYFPVQTAISSTDTGTASNQAKTCHLLVNLYL